METKRRFYVVTFLDKPFKNIDNYVCIPESWVIMRWKQIITVAFPKRDNPEIIKDRVKNGGKRSPNWLFFNSIYKYESDTFEDAQLWISKQISKDNENKKALLITEYNENSKEMLRISLKKRSTVVQSTGKSQEKRLKLDEAAKLNRINANLRPKSTESNLLSTTQLPEQHKMSDTVYYDYTKVKLNLEETEVPKKESLMNVVRNASSIREQPMMTNNKSQDNMRVSEMQFKNSCHDKVQSISSMIGSQVIRRIGSSQNLYKSQCIDQQANSDIHVKNESLVMLQPKQEKQDLHQNFVGSENHLPPSNSQSIRVPTLQGITNGMRPSIPSNTQNQSNVDLVAKVHNDIVTSTPDKTSFDMPTSSFFQSPKAFTTASSLDEGHNLHQTATMRSPDHGLVPNNAGTRFVYNPGTDSASGQTFTQNIPSTSTPTHPRYHIQQQMLDIFNARFRQMNDTMNRMIMMDYDLRRSISYTSDMYRDLMNMYVRFNGTTDLTNIAGSTYIAGNLQTKVSGGEDSSNDDHHNDKPVNETLNEGSNSTSTFVLPPEYNPHNTRWTLKYQNCFVRHGLTELLPRSNVFVSYRVLKNIQRQSNNCRILARLLLEEVFNRNALSVCLSMSEKPQDTNTPGSVVRPSLDRHASKVLLNFVLKCGNKRGWDAHTQTILDGIHSRVQQIRWGKRRQNVGRRANSVTDDCP